MKTKLTPEQFEIGLWGLLCLGLGLLIAGQIYFGLAQQGDAATRSPKPLAESVNKPALADPFQMPPIELFAETTLRPLFIVTRRPAPEGMPAEQTTSSMTKDQFILTGVSLSQNGKFAFLKEKAGNKSWVVSEGKDLNGIKVKTITADRVVLQQNNDTETLMLQTSKGQPAAPGQANAAETRKAAPGPAMIGMVGMTGISGMVGGGMGGAIPAPVPMPNSPPGQVAEQAPRPDAAAIVQTF